MYATYVKVTYGPHSLYTQPNVNKIVAYSRVAVNCSSQISMVQHKVGCFGQNKLIKWSLSQKKKKFSISGPNIHIFIGCVRCDICTSHLFIEILSRLYWITVPTTLSSKLIKTYVIILARFPTNHFIKAASSNRRNVIPLKKQICWIRFICSFLLPSYYI